MAFQLLQKDPGTQARLGRYETAHGTIETPVFMPVGTQATVKAMRPDELKAMGASIILGNTYHLFLRPGHRLIEELGGLHRFMNWQGPILTDSGGYQVFSLAKMCKLSESGVVFQSHLDGSSHLLSPELAIEIQEALGSDIMMVLDECLPYPSTHETVAKSLGLTVDWARRCLEAKRRDDNSLFAIVQGGVFHDLRRECAERLLELESKPSADGRPRTFDGIAVGGLSVGEPMELAYDTVGDLAPRLPETRPRYLMGVGMPQDIVTCIGLGIDMFDCVVPTRSARHGLLFTPKGRLYIKRAEFLRDSRPIDENCPCYTCKNYSRAYLRHLSLSKEVLSAVLNTIHNLHYFLNLLTQARLAIRAGDYAGFQRRFFSEYQTGETRVPQP
ncbi:MAG: tRNA guanosine(34) transglycosylase Tgt [Deltaproteobacteria bacterium]|nr:tRNA guanosine(34) transglycosylase Tgt [Deltaproteobacteria bacterium]